MCQVYLSTNIPVDRYQAHKPTYPIFISSVDLITLNYYWRVLNVLSLTLLFLSYYGTSLSKLINNEIIGSKNIGKMTPRNIALH